MVTVDREDDVIVYYTSREDAIAGRNKFYALDRATKWTSENSYMSGYGEVSLPRVKLSEKKPGMWYWICPK